MGRIFLFLEIITVSFAFAAAWFWFRSSQSFAPEISIDSIENVRLWLDHTVWLSRAAALCTGISAITHGMTYLAIRFGL